MIQQVLRAAALALPLVAIGAVGHPAAAQQGGGGGGSQTEAPLPNAMSTPANPSGGDPAARAGAVDRGSANDPRPTRETTSGAPGARTGPTSGGGGGDSGSSAAGGQGGQGGATGSGTR